MGDERELPIGDTPIGRARAAVAAAWVAAGWPHPPQTDGYALIEDHLVAYLALAFPILDPAQRREIVSATVTEFMARRHIQLPRESRLGSGEPGPSGSTPDDLAAAVRDAALDQVGRTRMEHNGVLGPSEKDDGWLAELAVGAEPTAVRAGLTELVKGGSRIDFLIITQYLDLADRDRTRPPRSAEVVAHLDDDVSEAVIRRSISSFRDRISRIERHDAHE